MLDWVHKTTLKAVEKGDYDDSPALLTLIASGLVEQRSDGGYDLTSQGRVALEDDKPERWERILWPIFGLCSLVVLIGTVGDWLT